MDSLVTSAREDGITLITLDDGKANALSPKMLRALGVALDEAERDGLPVVITGRPGVLSAGFDLKVLRGGGPAALGMLRAGFLLSARLLAFPAPVVIACTGHAVAMGAFLVLSGDYRIGAAGDFKLQANEVAIGLTLPRAATALCRARLAPAHFQRATTLSEAYDPAGAVVAGFLDSTAPADQVLAEAVAHARELDQLDRRAHVGTKRRARAETIKAIRWGLHLDLVELTWLGVRLGVRGLLTSKGG